MVRRGLLNVFARIFAGQSLPPAYQIQLSLPGMDKILEKMVEALLRSIYVHVMFHVACNFEDTFPAFHYRWALTLGLGTLIPGFALVKYARVTGQCKHDQDYSSHP